MDSKKTKVFLIGLGLLFTVIVGYLVLDENQKDTTLSSTNINDNDISTVPKVESIEKLTDSVNGNNIAIGSGTSYINSKIGIELQYPEEFKINTDKVIQTFTGGVQWHRLMIDDSSSVQQPLFVLETNADGYGPIHANLVYTVIENPNGTLTVASREEISSDHTNKNETTILVKPFESQSGQTYNIRMHYKNGSTNYQEVFDQILSSIKLTK